MTNEEKRIKIAKFLHPEYAQYEPEYWYTQEDDYERDLVWKTTDNGGITITSVRLPNYFSDLNACHEMEKLIMDESSITYLEWLTRLSCPWHATASQRAEAFGKTMNLW